MKIFHLIYIAIIAFGFVNCTENDRSIADSLNTEPVMVNEVKLPEDLSKVYYLVDHFDEYGTILTQLLRDGVEVRQAWEPANSSPCECATCVSAMIVEINAGEETLKNQGFIPEPGDWVMNCGVSSFKYFQFNQ